MRGIALTLVTLLSVGIPALSPPPPGGSDGGGSALIGGPAGQSATNNGSRLDIAIEQSGSSTVSGGSQHKSADGHGGQERGNTSSAMTEVDWATAATGALGGTAAAPCREAGTPVPCATTPPAAPKSGPHTPTLTDIASFRPATPSLTVEPGGFGIVGRPTNFVASATVQTLTGRLFDLPVTVRFTPAAYRFDYGDGTTRTTTTAGTTWKTADAPLFTRTATSHTYTNKALVTAQVTVAYTAQVAFTGYPDWYDVTGYVLAPTPTRQFQLYVARTVLVEHTCDEDPHGPGCPGTTP